MSARRLFRALLRLLPFDFRADYGAELERSFHEQRREAATPLRRAGVWAANVSALAAIGPREHVAQLRQDVRYAVRGMRRNPGFAAVAIITLALGTGVNTAIFSMVHAVMLAPLPYGEPTRLVGLMNRVDGSPRLGLSDPEFLDYAERSRSLEIAVMAPSAVTLTGGTGDPQRVASAVVSTNVLSVLGRRPAAGRTFTEDEGRRGSRAVMLSDGIWRERFAADPSLVGRTVLVEGQPRTVVGILPSDFVLPLDVAGGPSAAVLLPAIFDPAAPRNQRGGHYLTGVARLKPGATHGSASAEMDGIIAGLARQYPDQHDQRNFGVTLTPLREELLGDSRPVLLVLSAAVGLVLLLACANVANLMLARGEVRRRELAVRAALGASRFRMARQLLTEALVLALLATIAGLAIAHWVLGVVIATAPDALPRLGDVSLNPTVLVFAAFTAVAVTLLFGVLPATQLSRADAGDTIKDASRGSSAARTQVRRALVVCQVALAVILLVGAGLLVKSLSRVLQVPSGFDPDGLLTARVAAPASRYPDLPAVAGFYARLLDQVRGLPGVEVAGASTGLPLSVLSGDWSFDIEGRPRVNGRRPGAADWYVVTPGYFEALRVRSVAGRTPQPSDTADAPPVIFINESAARTIFPGEDPVGKRVMLSRSRGFEQPWRTIAGIVGDVRQRGLDQPTRPEMFIPHTQFLHFSPGVQARSMTVVMRTAGEPMSLVSAVRAALRRLDPEIPLASARAMNDVLLVSVADRRVHVLLFGAFAVLAIVLAMVGVYGLVAYDVVQRTREIGIRVALGATRASVRTLMLRQGLTLVAAGGAIGLGIAAALTGSLARLLFEVQPRDAAVFVTVAVLLFAVGALASYLPAWRAARVDPLTALRNE